MYTDYIHILITLLFTLDDQYCFTVLSLYTNHLHHGVCSMGNSYYYLCICIQPYSVQMCGVPEHCLCTDLNQLVFCDRPAIDIFPSFSVERVRCQRLIVQNTQITSLKGLYIKEWWVLEEICITGNRLMDCLREREWISPLCIENNITLFMPYFPGTTDGSITHSALTTTHRSAVNTSIIAGTTTVTSLNTANTAAYGAAVALSSVAGAVCIATGTVFAVLICRRRLRRSPQRNIIFNDVYRPHLSRLL